MQKHQNLLLGHHVSEYWGEIFCISINNSEKLEGQEHKLDRDNPANH